MKKNILILMILLSPGAFSPLALADDISQETLEYLETLPNEIVNLKHLKKYASYEGYKSWAVEVKNGRLKDSFFSKRSAQMDSQREADEVALIGCETKFGSDCILYYRGQENILKANLYAYNNSTLKGFLSSQVDICKKMGFESGDVGSCVQSKVDKVMNIPHYDPNHSASASQYSQQPRASGNWSALSNLGACISDGSCWGGRPISPAPRAIPGPILRRTYLLSSSYMNGMNRVCVYNGWTETMNGIGICPQSIQR